MIWELGAGSSFTVLLWDAVALPDTLLHGAHLTLSLAMWPCDVPPFSSPPWLSMSTSGTSMRTPTPPCFAAEPHVLLCTTCSRWVTHMCFTCGIITPYKKTASKGTCHCKRHLVRISRWIGESHRQRPVEGFERCAAC